MHILTIAKSFDFHILPTPFESIYIHDEDIDLMVLISQGKVILIHNLDGFKSILSYSSSFEICVYLHMGMPKENSTSKMYTTTTAELGYMCPRELSGPSIY